MHNNKGKVRISYVNRTRVRVPHTVGDPSVKFLVLNYLIIYNDLILICRQLYEGLVFSSRKYK